jgi:hypothetical protein
MKIFFDFEFTGLHKNTTPMSLGMVTEDGHKFYAEFNDYDKEQCDQWINENVVPKLKYNEYLHYFENDDESKTLIIKHDKSTISDAVKTWLAQFKNIEFWGDCVAFDWVLFADLYFMGSPARKYPNNFTSYQAFDIFTVLSMKYHNPKTNRHKILGLDQNESQHNALYDAEITMKLYNRFVKNVSCS